MSSGNLNVEQILTLMHRVHEENIISSDRAQFSEERIQARFQELNLKFKEVVKKLSNDFIDILAVTTITNEWKFLCLNFYYLHLLDKELRLNDLLSIAQAKVLQEYVKTIVHVGILQNLNPKLPHFKPLRKEKIEIQDQYYMLKGTVCGLFKYAMFPTLRYHIFPHILHGLFTALFQLAYCPIKKPLSCIEGEFLMTEEFYGELLGDQNRFQGVIETIKKTISSSLFLKEIMILFRAKSPIWFKRAVSSTLTSCLKEEGGLENLVRTMLAGVYDNTTTIWKVVDIVTQIVMSCVNSPDFNTGISPQVDELLKIGLECHAKDAIPFEKLFASIVKSVYPFRPELSRLFLNNMFLPLRDLSTNFIKTYSSDELSLLSKEVIQSIRVIPYVFLDTKDVSLPVGILTPFISILFNIYVKAIDSDSISLTLDLRDIILKYLKCSEKAVIFVIFDNFVFDRVVPELSNFRRDVIISTNSNNLLIEFTKGNSRYDVIKSAHTVYALCKTIRRLFHQYFGFLLYCLSNSDKYFPDISLLEGEPEGCLSAFERKIAVCEMLTVLSDDGRKNKYFTEQIPEELFDYFNQIFITSLKTESHNNTNDTMFQLMFTVVMILEDIVRNNQYDLRHFELFKTLQVIHNETCTLELKTLIEGILNRNIGKKPKVVLMDEVEEAIHETFNNSIPIKGHGLIILERLVSSKHPKALEKKHYIFTILKDNLSNRDTYIYQASVKGLAAMVNLGAECTSMVLDTLCSEYSEFAKEDFGEDAYQTRMKIAEVLLQISKKLGEMVPNYKDLLLNAFLNGTKDDDPLIRTSALSNLGEICKALGYSLGPIATEILICVHSIIATDKVPEPRRAAVFVIRQLLAGAGMNMLSTLKDVLLLIYHTLKFLYDRDNDEILKLHAQLAIEELDKNMKDLMLPQIEIDPQSKVIVLE